MPYRSAASHKPGPLTTPMAAGKGGHRFDKAQAASCVVLLLVTSGLLFMAINLAHVWKPLAPSLGSILDANAATSRLAHLQRVAGLELPEAGGAFAVITAGAPRVLLLSGLRFTCADTLADAMLAPPPTLPPTPWRAKGRAKRREMNSSAAPLRMFAHRGNANDSTGGKSDGRAAPSVGAVSSMQGAQALLMTAAFITRLRYARCAADAVAEVVVTSMAGQPRVIPAGWETEVTYRNVEGDEGSLVLPLNWNKLVLLIHAMEAAQGRAGQGAPDCTPWSRYDGFDLVMWGEWEPLLEEGLPEGWANHLNTGVMYVRNSAWSLALLRSLAEQRRNVDSEEAYAALLEDPWGPNQGSLGFYEQGALSYWVKQNPQEARQHIYFERNEVINGFWKHFKASEYDPRTGRRIHFPKHPQGDENSPPWQPNRMPFTKHYMGCGWCRKGGPPEKCILDVVETWHWLDSVQMRGHGNAFNFTCAS
eukprot:jgi/Mesvir1/1732/Mv21184-RA.1